MGERTDACAIGMYVNGISADGVKFEWKYVYNKCKRFTAMQRHTYWRSNFITIYDAFRKLFNISRWNQLDTNSNNPRHSIYAWRAWPLTTDEWTKKKKSKRQSTRFNFHSRIQISDFYLEFLRMCAAIEAGLVESIVK